MTVVVDAGAIVALLLGTDSDAAWVAHLVASEHLLAPALMPAEVANVLRRAALAGVVSAESASRAHSDLLELPVTLCEYEPFADRVWSLRASVTAYDGWYVAIAEEFDVPLVTLDERLSRAPGPRCAFRTPPERASR